MVCTYKRLLALATALASIAAACACGGAEEGEVKSALRDAVDAYNERDAEAYFAHLTDSAIEQQYGLSREEAAAAVAEFIGEPQIEVRKLTNTRVSARTASLDFEHTEGRVVVLERVSFVKEDDRWKIDGFEDRPVEIPEGDTAVKVEAKEFSFRFDAASIDDGDIALAVHNAGDQEHEVVLARIESGRSLEALVAGIVQDGGQGGEPPEGVQEIVAFASYQPGDSGNIVFAEPLDAGRYGLFCFFPDVADPEMTPHALKGMYAEFTLT